MDLRCALPTSSVSRLTSLGRLSARPASHIYNQPVLRPYRGASPRVHPSAFIDDSAQGIGNVEIGEESGVWMNAVIRGDVHWIRIGRRANGQDGTGVHAMPGPPPHSTGAHVGSGAIVAAGTLVTEGMKVPPKSLVMGSPGKVKRLLTQAEIAEIQLYADRYVQYRLDYMNPGAGLSRRQS